AARPPRQLAQGSASPPGRPLELLVEGDQIGSYVASDMSGVWGGRGVHRAAASASVTESRKSCEGGFADRRGPVRRILLCALAMFFVLGAASGASAATAGRPVDGTLTGPGGFRLEGCGLVTEIGSGTFRAKGLGPGTYAFNVCVSINGTIMFDGTITLTTAGGATLTGTIGGTFTGGPGPPFDAVMPGGTKQFAHAGGTLTVGPLVESDF